MSNKASTWPNGKKIAVSVTVMFEAWTEGKAPSYSVQASALKSGVADAASQAWATYGGRVGVWRLLRLFNNLGIPATFFTSGRCAELFPEAVKQIVSDGHDLAAHSYAQDVLLTYCSTVDEQRNLIRKSISSLTDLTGHKVTGWGSPGVAFTPEANDLLVEAGLKWHTDVTYEDLPFRVHTPHGVIVAVPTTDFSDNRVLKSNPRDYYDAQKGTFDYLERSEDQSLLVLVMHAQFGGRPLVTSVIEDVLRYMAKSPHVWFTRHDALADWALHSDRDLHSYADRYFKSRASVAKK